MGLFGRYDDASDRKAFVDRVDGELERMGLDRIQGQENQYSLFVAVAKICEIEDFKEKNHHRYDEAKLGYIHMKQQEAIFEQNNVIIRLLDDIRKGMKSDK